ncbi:MAG TPA: hypothetical protein VNY07_02310 [Chthoniobacterales bacterium]|jgi:hypothetical protein|nr:hypothetical protein [Chthoniobacterales bacterium]
MKSTCCSLFLKITLLIVSLTFYLGSSTYGQARDRNVLSPGPVRPGSLEYRTELPQGHLKVYSVTGEPNDGDAWYFPRSSFVIYTIDGKLFKTVESQHSADDIIPEVVTLPVGTYTVVARSKRDGYVGILVVIKEGQQTILDLDLWKKKAQPI